MPFLLFVLMLCFAKASTRKVGGSVRRSGRGVSGSLGRGGAKATRFSRESTMQISGQEVRLVGADRQWEETPMLNLKPLGTVKRVTKARRPLQEGAKVRTTRPIGERTVSPSGSSSETFSESFSRNFGGEND